MWTLKYEVQSGRSAEDLLQGCGGGPPVIKALNEAIYLERHVASGETSLKQGYLSHIGRMDLEEKSFSYSKGMCGVLQIFGTRECIYGSDPTSRTSAKVE